MVQTKFKLVNCQLPELLIFIIKNFTVNQPVIRERLKLLPQIVGLKPSQAYLCTPFKKSVTGIAVITKTEN